jgi:hypothetical protein
MNNTITINKKAQKLKNLADSMSDKIKEKLNPPISNQRITSRRARIADSMKNEGERLQQIQSWLYAMGDACEKEALPDILNNIANKTQLQELQRFYSNSWKDDDIQCFLDDKSGYNTDSIKRLQKANINNVEQLKQAVEALQKLYQPEPVNPVELQIKDIERSLIGTNIPYYFPTPKQICQELINHAYLEQGMKILEPSAGKGDIAQAIKEAFDADLDVCEINYNLGKILTLKGFNLIAQDCFDLTEPVYDRIIANPPFGSGQELDHVYHYYNLLVEGGLMVVILPESIEFNSRNVYKTFREWLQDKCRLNEPLPDGAFLKSDHPTGVKTRILVIEKN